MLSEGRAIRLVEDSIYSALPDQPHKHQYDGRATIYDLVVGMRLYNRLMWGAALADYVAFARQAVTSNHTGVLLDAGCGSLLFSARAYVDSRRPIIACDQSLSMLRRARARLVRMTGHVPERIVLLQADLSDPLFRPGSISTILCMNVLHHVADADALVSRLKQLLTPDGQLHLASLVKGDRVIGERYLDMLYRQGGFVSPRRSQDVERVLVGSFGQAVQLRTDGNMAYATAIRQLELSLEVATHLNVSDFGAGEYSPGYFFPVFAGLRF